MKTVLMRREMRSKEQILAEYEPTLGFEGNCYLLLELLADIRDQIRLVAEAINRPQIRYTSP